MCTLLGCINDSLKDCLPETSGKNKKSIPAWNNEVKPFREDAMFWHSLWISAGRPLNNTLHNIMKQQEMSITIKCVNAERLSRHLNGTNY